jgi:HAD superfamily hydrolase (TIGR01509 family)
MIKVIAFDYAEVIAEGPMSKWRRDNPHKDPNKLVGYEEDSKKWDLGQMDATQMDIILSDMTGIAPESIWQQFDEITKPNLRVIDLIKKLKTNYTIFLFSNFVSEKLNKLLDRFGITGLFDEIIISSDYCMRKPDAEFFEVLVKKAGVTKEEIFFTDDSLENIEAANAFGIKSYQFTTYEQLVKDLRSEGIIIT